MIRNKIIAVDFDGTCVSHRFPDIGREIGAPPVLRKLLEQQNRLILHTMRSDEPLEEAIRWFTSHDLVLFGVNRNPDQDSWTSSPKVYAHLYIDDAAFGAPLRIDSHETRPYIDWRVIEDRLCI